MTNPNDSACGTQTLGETVETVGDQLTKLLLTQPLTKRELFAAMAMQGLLVNYCSNGMYANHSEYPMVESAAVRQADQLIAELNK